MASPKASAGHLLSKVLGRGIVIDGYRIGHWHNETLDIHSHLQMRRVDLLPPYCPTHVAGVNLALAHLIIRSPSATVTL
ncbi:hypothetical protein NCC49_002846 [Naganishia albida]|nr:hypothetical protein NCC49_002846 [Naganishia albida]